MKKILLFILLLLPSMVLARSKTKCDYTLVSNLKKLTSNVDVTYTYRIDDIYVYYDITLSNIQPDMYFIDTINDKTYYYSDTVNGEITLKDYYSGKVTYSFYSNNNECLNEKLGVKTVNLPYYNSYYEFSECEGLENYKLCQRWSKFDGTYDDFLNSIDRYNDYSYGEEYFDNKLNWFDKLIGFYIKYYYILLPLTIMVFVGILYFVRYIKNRLNRFDI